jgi:hypothetical protein
MPHDRYAPTPLELLIDALQGHELPLLTDHGTNCFRQHVQTALPFLPAIIVTGQWYDWTDGPVVDAVGAILASEPQPTAESLARDPDGPKTRELEAHYITGLVVGLALANALLGARGPQ